VGMVGAPCAVAKHLAGCDRVGDLRVSQLPRDERVVRLELRLVFRIPIALRFKLARFYRKACRPLLVPFERLCTYRLFENSRRALTRHVRHRPLPWTISLA